MFHTCWKGWACSGTENGSPRTSPTSWTTVVRLDTSLRKGTRNSAFTRLNELLLPNSAPPAMFTPGTDGIGLNTSEDVGRPTPSGREEFSVLRRRCSLERQSASTVD
ncbi:hypothetical protein GCM10027597_53480 [Saccharopolyspora tripterygii]